MKKDTGIVMMHGREYKTVASRVAEFRGNDQFAGWGIDTNILSNVDGVVIIKATICDADGKQIGAGTASEKEGSSNINKTSHIENCETSAIGRALASIGLAGTEYATADEVVNAINNNEALGAKALPPVASHPYSLELFEKAKGQMKQMIVGGKETPASLIAMLKKKYGSLAPGIADEINQLVPPF